MTFWIQRKKIVILSAVLLFIIVPLQADEVALQTDPNNEVSYYDMSLEELMEVPVVVSSSRQEQKITESSAPISIITAEDIHYSGLTTIPEILQFTPGVDVRRLDRQYYMVGVRGLFGTLSDRTLILIDGMPATDIVRGTTHWLNLPILIKDIERIEIVHGPAGAAWGANAMNGVINIITKKPGQYQGGLISTTINEFGDSYTQLQYGRTQGKWSWKATVGYEDVEDSDAAGAGRYVIGSGSPVALVTGFDSYTARDWGRLWKFNTQAQYRCNDQTKWNFGAAHSSGQQGDFELLGVYPRRDILSEYTRVFTRLDHQFDENTSGYLRWFSDYWNLHRRVITDHVTYMENDIEGQITFKPMNNHLMSVGGNVRCNQIRTSNFDSANEDIVGDTDECWVGFFLMDRWKVTQRLTLEGQVRLDHFSETTTDWSARVMTLYALDEQKDHILRAGFARAFRAPNLMLRYLYNDRVGIVPPDKTTNESSYSLELGYTGKLSKSLQLNVDGYYQRYERLIGATGKVPPASFTNIDGATGYGGECSLSWQHKAGKITGWYGFNELVTDRYSQSIRAFGPSKHKAGLRSLWHLNKDWVFNANCSFQNGIEAWGTMPEGLHSVNRLDLTLSRAFAKGKGEVMVGVTDVLNKTSDPVFDEGYFTAHETPGRTFFARLQLKF